MSALRLLGATAGIALAYSTIHILLSPLLRPIDSSFAGSFRAPVIEEAFKYFIFCKIYNATVDKSTVLKIGFGMGLAESVINFYAVKGDMMTDLASSFPEMTHMDILIGVAIALFIKMAFTSACQSFTLFIGIRFSKDNFISALFISITCHWLLNFILVSSA